MFKGMVSKDWTTFSARDYLHEYYSDMGAENLALLRFLVRAFQDVPAHKTVLDFGGGPTIYTLISASAKADEIHFCDFLEANLEEVRLWLQDNPGAFDWTQFIKTALVLEGKNYSSQSVATRADDIRKRVTRVIQCDANLENPIPGEARLYDVVVTNFCAESATDDREQWRKFVSNITSLLKPNGKLILSALKGADSYAVGKVVFPAVYVLEDDLIQVLSEAGFAAENIDIESVPADRPSRHYEGLMLTTAIKSAENHAQKG